MSTPRRHTTRRMLLASPAGALIGEGRWGRPTHAAALASTLGLALVGAAEALYAGASLPFALALYGSLGAALGLPLGLAWGFRHPRPAEIGPHPLLAPVAAGVTGLATLVVARHLLFRDLFDERSGGLALLLAALAALAVAAGAYLATRASQRVPIVRGALLPPYPLLAPLACLLGLAGYLLLGGGPGVPAEEPPASARSGSGVILIVADALRADVVGAAGERGGSPTPTLDRLAAAGTRYANALAQSSWTKPSMASLLTGLYPAQHRAHGKTARLPDVTTMASAFKGAGFATGAVVTNYNLESFGAGFDRFTYLPPARYLGAPPSAARLSLYNAFRLLRERYFPYARSVERFYWPAEAVTAEGLRLIDALGDQRFFVYLHYMDPHDPFFPASGGRSWARVEDPRPHPRKAGAMRAAYLDDVRRFDRGLQRLLDGLAARGLTERVQLIVTSDHGEEFADHDGFFHGTTLYHELLHVPLVIHGGAFGPAVIPGLARHIDLLPTLAAEHGLPVPPGLPGLDLRAGVTPSVALAEVDHQGMQLAAIVTGGYKLLRANRDNWRRLGERELYDLLADPGERADLSGQLPALAADLSARLEAELARLGGDAKAASAAPALSPEAEAELRALGYIQ